MRSTLWLHKLTALKYTLNKINWSFRGGVNNNICKSIWTHNIIVTFIHLYPEHNLYYEQDINFIFWLHWTFMERWEIYIYILDIMNKKHWKSDIQLRTFPNLVFIPPPPFIIVSAKGKRESGGEHFTNNWEEKKKELNSLQFRLYNLHFRIILKKRHLVLIFHLPIFIFIFFKRKKKKLIVMQLYSFSGSSL